LTCQVRAKGIYHETEYVLTCIGLRRALRNGESVLNAIGDSDEQIIGGVKLPRSEKGIFASNRRLVAIDFVGWLMSAKTEEERKLPVMPSDLDKYRMLEAKKEDITRIELKAPGRVRNGSLTVLVGREVLNFVPQIFPNDDFFEELRAMLQKSFPEKLVLVGEPITPLSSRIPNWMKWAVILLLLLFSSVYFYLAYLGVVSF
jgi:hypothetical protein